jgi:tetratricopeptide (TPR) repeat protein
LSAGDQLSGKWTGQLQFPGHSPDEFHVQLRVTGTKITGTVRFTTSGTEGEIEGEANGTWITLTQVRETKKGELSLIVPGYYHATLQNGGLFGVFANEKGLSGRRYAGSRAAFFLRPSDLTSAAAGAETTPDVSTAAGSKQIFHETVAQDRWEIVKQQRPDWWQRIVGKISEAESANDERTAAQSYAQATEWFRNCFVLLAQHEAARRLKEAAPNEVLDLMRCKLAWRTDAAPSVEADRIVQQASLAHTAWWRDQGVSLADRTVPPHQQVYAYAAAARAAFADEDQAGYKRLIELARGRAKNIEDPLVAANAYLQLVQTQATCEDESGATVALDLAAANVEQVASDGGVLHCRLAATAIRLGDERRAERFVALALLDTKDDAERRLVLARSLAWGGLLPRALRANSQSFEASAAIAHVAADTDKMTVCEIARQKALVLLGTTDHPSDSGLRDLACSLAICGQFDEAEARLERISDANERALACSRLATAMAQEGRFAEARRICGRCEVETIRTSAVSEVAFEQAQDENTSMADLLAWIEGHDQPMTRACAYSAVSVALGRRIQAIEQRSKTEAQEVAVAVST